MNLAINDIKTRFTKGIDVLLARKEEVSGEYFFIE